MACGFSHCAQGYARGCAAAAAAAAAVTRKQGLRSIRHIG